MVWGTADLYELIKILNHKLNLNHLFLQKDERLKWSLVKNLLNYPNNWMAKKLMRVRKDNTMILNKIITGEVCVEECQSDSEINFR